jgi:hypothetical protein
VSKPTKDGRQAAIRSLGAKPISLRQTISIHKFRPDMKAVRQALQGRS